MLSISSQYEWPKIIRIITISQCVHYFKLLARRTRTISNEGFFQYMPTKNIPFQEIRCFKNSVSTNIRQMQSWRGPRRQAGEGWRCRSRHPCHHRHRCGRRRRCRPAPRRPADTARSPGLGLRQLHRAGQYAKNIRAPIVAWKCNSPRFEEIMTDQPIDADMMTRRKVSTFNSAKVDASKYTKVGTNIQNICALRVGRCEFTQKHIM